MVKWFHGALMSLLFEHQRFQWDHFYVSIIFVKNIQINQLQQQRFHSAVAITSALHAADPGKPVFRIKITFFWTKTAMKWFHGGYHICYTKKGLGFVLQWNQLLRKWWMCLTSVGLACLPSIGFSGANKLTSTSCSLLFTSLSFRHTCSQWYKEKIIVCWSVTLWHTVFFIIINLDLLFTMNSSKKCLQMHIWYQMWKKSKVF